MQNYLLRISMWVLGISALVGNLLSVILRLTEKSRSPVQRVQTVLIGNLAASDFLMGIYMLILASADLYYGDEYFLYSDQWRSGIVCKIAGFISLVSSEASVLLLTVISYDRFMGVVFPFSRRRLTPGSVKLAVGVLWLLVFAISIVPILLAGPTSDFYDLSDVCIGLPLITRPSSFQFQPNDLSQTLTFDLPVKEDSKPAWYFSIALFLVVNLVCFLGILLIYIIIFYSLRQSANKVKRTIDTKEEMKMATKMALIVGTDFLCWMPVIIMGILSQTGAVVIPLEAYTWSVVFVLPINSSLNPYIYTITSLLGNQKLKKKHAADKARALAGGLVRVTVETSHSTKSTAALDSGKTSG